MNSGAENQAELVEESIQHAKEAITLDVKDGNAWCKFSNKLLLWHLKKWIFLCYWKVFGIYPDRFTCKHIFRFSLFFLIFSLSCIYIFVYPFYILNQTENTVSHIFFSDLKYKKPIFFSPSVLRYYHCLFLKMWFVIESHIGWLTSMVSAYIAG